jgi:Tfp pilus assembly protein PilF
MSRPLPTIAIALLLAAPAAAQDHQHASPVKLGTVHFETSCAPATRADFDRGMALLHSFWFSAAVDAFNDVLKADPTCAMAHWGIALSWWGNPFGPVRPAASLAAGLTAVDKARAIAAGTPREHGYVNAVDVLFRDAGTRDQRTRVVDYEKAMQALADANPADIEARIFYALALAQAALPTDKTYANQLRAAAILEEEFAKQPQHPGLAHYIIHAFDVPPLASRGLNAARRYAVIAPDAPHALHMPSHTYTRVGLWQDSVDANLKSAQSAHRDPGAAAEELHALDYQAYAYLQMAQDDAARKTIDVVPGLQAQIPNAGVGNAAPPSAGHYAAAAIPARYALERNDWQAAAALTPPGVPTAWAEAVTHFARALGNARLKNVDAAQKDVDRLGELREAVRKTNDAYWTEQVDIQRLGAAAWTAYAAGKNDEALTLMQEAATREDATEKAAVTPGPIKPARELLGDMLMEMNKPSEALAAYEATLKKEPNRVRAVYGAARAAKAAGQNAKAAEYYKQVVTLASGPNAAARPELTEAKAASR